MLVKVLHKEVILPQRSTKVSGKEYLRARVIEYVKEKYGSDKVAQIITYNVMKAKQTLRDTARALGISYQTADTLAKHGKVAKIT